VSTKPGVLTRALLVLCFAFLGLSAGMAVGGRLVPDGSGLAGPVIALGYGFVGFCVAVLLGIVLSIKLGPTAFRRALLGSAVLTALILAWVAVQVVRARSAAPVGARSDEARAVTVTTPI
jgi:hypothetical protein